MLIRCNGNVLIPLSAIDKCVDRQDCIIVYVDDESHYATGEDAEVIRSLVAQKPQKAAKEQSNVRKEEQVARGFPSIPVKR